VLAGGGLVGASKVQISPWAMFVSIFGLRTAAGREDRSSRGRNRGRPERCRSGAVCGPARTHQRPDRWHALHHRRQATTHAAFLLPELAVRGRVGHSVLGPAWTAPGGPRSLSTRRKTERPSGTRVALENAHHSALPAHTSERRIAGSDDTVEGGRVALSWQLETTEAKSSGEGPRGRAVVVTLIPLPDPAGSPSRSTLSPWSPRGPRCRNRALRPRPDVLAEDRKPAVGPSGPAPSCAHMRNISPQRVPLGRSLRRRISAPSGPNLAGKGHFGPFSTWPRGSYLGVCLGDDVLVTKSPGTTWRISDTRSSYIRSWWPRRKPARPKTLTPRRSACRSGRSEVSALVVARRHVMFSMKTTWLLRIMASRSGM
jgi:hypothetical protein